MRPPDRKGRTADYNPSGVSEPASSGSMSCRLVWLAGSSGRISLRFKGASFDEGAKMESKVESLSPPEISEFCPFQPDTLVSAEFCDAVQKRSRLLPEHALMRAVLDDAVCCFQKCLSARDKAGKKMFREVEEWILEENSEWIFCFENVCDVLGLDPQYIRRGLLRWKERRIAACGQAKLLRSQPCSVRDAAKDHYRSYRSVR